MHKASSANHHYVPRVILRNFCFKGQTVYYYSKDSPAKGVVERNIDSIFKRRHLNSVIRNDGSKHDGVEKFFSENFDDKIKQWTESFMLSLKTGRVRFSGEEDRARYIQFFYNHMKRSPDFHQPIVEDASRKIFLDRSIEELTEKYGPLTEQDIALLGNPDFKQRVVNNSRVENLARQAFHILDILSSLKVHLATPTNPKKQFVVGSNPVVRFNKLDGQKLGDVGVELWTTFSPKLAVGLAVDNGHPDVLEIDTNQVRKLNSTLAKNSTAVASASKTLLVSLSSQKYLTQEF